MYRTLEEAIQSIERSKREVEERIKARALGVNLEDCTLTGLDGQPKTCPVRVPRFRVQGRTIYTSGSKYSKG
jgi:hypothetical protein